VRVVVNFRVCEIATALQLIAPTGFKRSINPITNPNRVYNYFNTSQLVSEMVGTETALGSHVVYVTLNYTKVRIYFGRGTAFNPRQLSPWFGDHLFVA
jgi:hypothetical protein